MQERPRDTEFAPYYGKYVALVPETDILPVLHAQLGEMRALATAIPPDRETYRYGEGKWSVREVFGHLNDAERVFAYRASCISRGDETPLPSFDENLYVAAAGFDTDRLAALSEEFLHLRQAALIAFRRLDDAAWKRMGTASGHPVSVRALAYIMAGHVRHHVTILRERYVAGV